MMGAVVEAGSTEVQVTELVSMVVFMCLWWNSQYCKDIIQAELCAINIIVFFLPHRCVVKAINSPAEKGENLPEQEMRGQR